MPNRIFLLNGLHPHVNLSLEESLLAAVPSGGLWLLLWQNERTVVIGRNQNAWRECRVEQLRAEGGLLARRISGGGAVYHDGGNLNFSFLWGGPYDEAHDNHILMAALSRLGVAVRAGGRNDLTLEDGRKCSGHAYHNGREASLHHGTLLCRTNTENAARYLTPPAAKLAAKGVASVRARIANLSDVRADVSVSQVIQALAEEFRAAYPGAPTITDPFAVVDRTVFDRALERHSSDAWQLGESPAMSVQIERRFSFGGLALGFLVEQGRVRACTAESDALDAPGVQALAHTLIGADFTPSALARRARELFTSGPHALPAQEIAEWLQDERI